MDRAHEAAPRRILSGGTVVTPNAVVEDGSVVIKDGRIVAVTSHAYPTSTTPHEVVTDVGGQFVLPGLICLHNDAVEKAINPRPFANLPAPLALLTLDRSLTMAGVTTQFHAISFNDLPGKERTVAGTAAMHDALAAFGASGAALIDHHVLYRCDVRLAASLDAILARLPQASARLVSLNDHAPGQGQLRDRVRTAECLGPDLTGMSVAEWLTEREAFARTSEGQIAQTYAALRDATREYSITLMSHDDDSAEKVDAMHALGCRIAEFPVTTEAARHARERGMYISMGAPNAGRVDLRQREHARTRTPGVGGHPRGGLSRAVTAVCGVAPRQRERTLTAPSVGNAHCDARSGGRAYRQGSTHTWHARGHHHCGKRRCGAIGHADVYPWRAPLHRRDSL